MQSRYDPTVGLALRQTWRAQCLTGVRVLNVNETRVAFLFYFRNMYNDRPELFFRFKLETDDKRNKNTKSILFLSSDSAVSSRCASCTPVCSPHQTAGTFD